jgi:hypothetical protein
MSTSQGCGKKSQGYAEKMPDDKSYGKRDCGYADAD